MNLHEYLSSPGALSVAELAKEIGLTGTSRNQQVWQWQHAHEGRRPNPEYCVAIERATANRVKRWDLRPDDWHRIWPELIGKKGSPPVPEVQAA
jgi:DNA-binding transcriptional regulator YdaS (Cro superfamily)